MILGSSTTRSMQARDVEPTRLEAAKSALLRTFLGRAPDRLKVGLIVFCEAQAALPTTDHEIVRDSIGEIGVFTGYGGTAIGDALKAAVELAEQAVPELAPDDDGPGQTIAYYAQGEALKERNKFVSILFLSDGLTRGRLQPLEGAQLASDAGIPVYTIALGTPEGVLRGDFGGAGHRPERARRTAPPGFGEREIPVPPDPETLGEIARMTGGEFSEAKDSKTLEQVYEQLGSDLGRKPGQVEITSWSGRLRPPVCSSLQGSCRRPVAAAALNSTAAEAARITPVGPRAGRA